MLEYHLIKNPISEDADTFIAVSTNSESLTIEDVFDRIVRPGSISKVEALASFEALTEGIMQW